MKKIIFSLLFVVLLFGSAYIVIKNYGFFFSKQVSGTIVNVSRVTEISGLLANATTKDSQIHSYAIAIRNSKDGVIFTASSEDRQWAVVSKGNCVVARLFPYPPWNFERAGTYHNARLEVLKDCPGEHTEPASAHKAPAPEKTPSSGQNDFSGSYQNFQKIDFETRDDFTGWVNFKFKKLTSQINEVTKDLNTEQLSQEGISKLVLQQKSLENSLESLKKEQQWTDNKWNILKQFELIENHLQRTKSVQ